MKTSLCKFSLVLLASLPFWAAPATANDVLPPCWRGQAGTTFQRWTFPVAFDEQPAPDLATNAYGTALATVAPNWDGGAEGWTYQFPLCGFGCAQSNYFDMGPEGVLTFTIPSGPGASPTAYRLVSLQVAQFISAVFDNVYASIAIPNGVQIGGQTNIVQTISGGTGSWVVQQTLWQLPGSNTSHTITLTTGPSGGVIDGVIVDTRYVDPAVISPGGSLNLAQQSECANFNVQPGSVYTWELKDATGLAGVGFDQLLVSTGNLNVQATSVSNCTINLTSLNGAVAGPAANFNNNLTSSWTIATAAVGNLLNFAPDKFTVNQSTNYFRNDLQGGAFTLTTNGNSLQIQFLPNHAPSASPAAFSRSAGMPVRITIADLLNAHTSDVDGDGRTLVSVSPSTNGATITMDATYVYYTPANNTSENFSYTVKDNRLYRPGDTALTAQALIQITTIPTASSAQGITMNGTNVTASFAGIPGYTYIIQRSPDMSVGSWIDLFTTNAPVNGLFQYVDSNPLSPSGFYRTRSP